MTIASSPFFAPPGTLPRGQFRPRIQPAAKQSCFFCTDGRDEPAYKLPAGTLIIWDIRCIGCGFARPIKGRYAEVLVPYGAPEPALPAGSDPKEWQPLMKSQIWTGGVQGHRDMLRELSVLGSIICLNAFHQLYTMLAYKKEAQAGQIPVLEVHEFAPIDTDYGTFGQPVLELKGFTDRDDDVYGPPIIDPPVPILSGSVPRPQLSNDNGHDTTAPAVMPVPKPANDPLASFRPVGTQRTPY